MAYEAHKWKIGEEITSDKLNHIEKGIEEAGLPREITDPQDGQTLKYDAASGKWVNGEGGSGSSTLVETINLNEQEKGTFDHTWQEIHDAMPNVILEEKLPDGGYVISVGCLGKRPEPDNEKPYYVQSYDRSYFASTPSDYPTNISGGGEDREKS